MQTTQPCPTIPGSSQFKMPPTARPELYWAKKEKLYLQEAISQKNYRTNSQRNTASGRETVTLNKNRNKSIKRDAKTGVLTTSTTTTIFHAAILSCQSFCNTSYCSPYCFFFTQKPDFSIEKASQRGGIVEDFGSRGMFYESRKTHHKNKESN